AGHVCPAAGRDPATERDKAKTDRSLAVVLGAIFGFSSAIGLIWWLFYVLGRDEVTCERLPSGSLAGSRTLRTSSDSA
ncbi:MAG: hypothetical protein WBW51_14445, partial [Methyloceanibacter sp.]